MKTNYSVFRKMQTNFALEMENIKLGERGIGMGLLGLNKQTVNCSIGLSVYCCVRPKTAKLTESNIPNPFAFSHGEITRGRNRNVHCYSWKLLFTANGEVITH